MLIILLSTLIVICSALWQQIGLTSQLEYDLQNTVNWKWLVDFKTRKINLFHLTIKITVVLLMQKLIGLSLVKNNLLQY